MQFAMRHGGPRAGTVAVLAAGLLLAVTGCGVGQRRGSLTIRSFGGRYPSEHITRLASAVLDSTTLSIAWIDASQEGDRVWQCRVSRSGTALALETQPVALDRGHILDVAVYGANRLIHGVAYTKDDQLFLCQDGTGVSRALSRAVQQTPLSIGAAVTTSGEIVVVGLFIELHHLAPLTFELLGITVSGDDIDTTHLASLDIPPGRLKQPAPVLRIADEQLELTTLVRGGRVLSIDSVSVAGQAESSRAGQLLTLSARVNRNRLLTVTKHRIVSLPNDEDVSYTNDFATWGPAQRFMVAGTPRKKNLDLGSGSVTYALSSALGVGSVSSTPTAQVLASTDTTALVVWIDTERQGAILSLAEGASDPTLAGGEIRARLLRSDGPPLPIRSSVFPVAGPAQCLQLIDWGGQPVLVWAQESGAKAIHVQLLPPQLK